MFTKNFLLSFSINSSVYIPLKIGEISSIKSLIRNNGSSVNYALRIKLLESVTTRICGTDPLQSIPRYHRHNFDVYEIIQLL